MTVMEGRSVYASGSRQEGRKGWVRFDMSPSGGVIVRVGVDEVLLTLEEADRAATLFALVVEDAKRYVEARAAEPPPEPTAKPKGAGK